MANGSHQKVKLNVRVPPSKKQEWKESLDEGETLTALVRRAVDRELRDEYVSKNAIDDVIGTPKESDVDLSSVTDRLDELQQTVNAFENKLDSLSAINEEDDEDIEELAMDLLHRIPSFPGSIPKTHLKEMGKKKEDSQEMIKMILDASRNIDTFPNVDGTAHRLAREIREPTPKVREALIYLETETTEDVTSTVFDGRRHWMRGV